MQENSLEDFGELTEYERELLNTYRIRSAEALYSRMLDNPEAFRNLIGRSDAGYGALEQRLHEYLFEKNPDFLRPRDHPPMGTGALPPPDKD